LEPLRVVPQRRLPADGWLPGRSPGPRRQFFGGREDRHVDADLGDDALGAAPLNAGNRAEQLNGLLERGHLFPDRLGQRSDLLVEEVDVRKDRADPDGVQMIKAALQRLAQRRQLGAQPALGEVGQHVGVGRALDQRVEHPTARHAEDVGGDAVFRWHGSYATARPALRVSRAQPPSVVPAGTYASPRSTAAALRRPFRDIARDHPAITGLDELGLPYRTDVSWSRRLR
jgi:hypothetical protein